MSWMEIWLAALQEVVAGLVSTSRASPGILHVVLGTEYKKDIILLKRVQSRTLRMIMVWKGGLMRSG